MAKVGGINTLELAEQCVTTSKLALQAVTNAVLGLLAVATGNLQDGAVTAAKLAPVVAASYYMSANVLVNNGAFTRVNYDTKVYDTDNAVTTGAGWVFTCPAGKGGLYRISAEWNLQFGGATALNNYIITIYKNGAETMRLAQLAITGWTGVANIQLGGSGELLLAPGDTIGIDVYQANGGGVQQTILGGQIYTWVTIAYAGRIV